MALGVRLFVSGEAVVETLAEEDERRVIERAADG
jgi:hypothetical protein